jgi:hypothetical protein
MSLLKTEQDCLGNDRILAHVFWACNSQQLEVFVEDELYNLMNLPIAFKKPMLVVILYYPIEFLYFVIRDFI